MAARSASLEGCTATGTRVVPSSDIMMRKSETSDSRPAPFEARVRAAVDDDRLRIREHLRVTGKGHRSGLAPQALELGKRRVGGAGALVPRVPQRVELAPDEDHDVFLARRSGAGRVSQAVAQAAHVAVSEPHRLELRPRGRRIPRV